MKWFETIRLAFRAIFSNRMRSFLTVLGIVIGVTSVILLVSVVTGLQKFITNEISSLGPNIMFVQPGNFSTGGPGGATVNRLTSTNIDALRQGLRGQAEVSAALTKTGLLKRVNKSSKNAIIYGVEANLPKVLKAFEIETGRFFNEGEADGGRRVAVLGPTAKQNLFGGSDPLGEEIQVGDLRYRVVGTFKAQGAVFGIDQDNLVAIPLNTALKQFGVDIVNEIYIAVNDGSDIRTVQRNAQNVLAKRISEEDFTVMTQEQTLSTVAQITGVLTVALGGIAAISLVVGGIGIMNIMLVSVTERTREIGLRKALGAKPADIRNQFLVEAVTLSSIGGVVGILLGYLLSFVVNFFLATSVPLWAVMLSFGFSMAVGVIFGVAPAIRAARLNPIQALRYE